MRVDREGRVERGKGELTSWEYRIRNRENKEGEFVRWKRGSWMKLNRIVGK